MFRLVIFSSLFLAKFVDSDRQLKPTEQRIVGGRDTDITEVPYVVSVQYKNGHECGGSIIGAKHILTAAHCVDGKDENLFSVRAGSSFRNRDGQVVDVVNVTKHPHFFQHIGEYDAAVLVLKEPLTSGEGVQIATLANVEPQVGEMVLVPGWGALGESADGSNLLQSVELPVVLNKSCKERYKQYINITNRMFCAGFLKGGKDACNGDSGGPAVVKGKVVGIVSWGDGCARSDSPGVYTNVASILPWITAQTQE